ncbi:tetratricopeptide repeat protein [Pseudomonas mangiferae]|uniref:Tetratricopeptide repeat protein n=1 Tax=Pseudomonas mangiferae TaxID=2593654 RepID=A0A553GX89_9PSED|nr:DUF4013 domain-containing protein [Pseudomonas mangiferae]TRX74106.1 hypothetical protein FM069_13270 [Pseudomonas mangiferae]
MDITHCHYHPAEPATWHCAPCRRPYGDCCVPLNADAPDQTPGCPLCRRELTFLGAANSAQPFWERLPSFFRYGLQPGPLSLCAVLALAGMFMPSSLLLWFLLFSLATKYLYGVIEACSQAESRAPSLTSAFFGEGYSLFFKQLVVLLVAAIPLWLARGSETLYLLVDLAIMLVLPASIIRLALDKELSAALSPVQVGQVIGAMGWRYLILFAFLFALWQSPAYLAFFLGEGVPKAVLLPVMLFFSGYFSVVMCALMGYAVFQYQGPLGYIVATEDGADAYPEAEWRRRVALIEAEVRLKEGQGDSALDTLASALERTPEDFQLNERFHRLLFALRARERCLRHLAHYLPLAVRANPAQAATAFLNGRALQADYLPDDPAVCEALAVSLSERHKHREALSLLRNLHRRAPDYPFLARAYLLAARLLAEGPGDVEQARKLLAFVQARYPRNVQSPEARQLEALLTRLAPET